MNPYNEFSGKTSHSQTETMEISKLKRLEAEEQRLIYALHNAERARREEESRIAFETVPYKKGDRVLMQIQIDGILTQVTRTINDIYWWDHWQTIIVVVEEGQFVISDVLDFATHSIAT